MSEPETIRAPSSHPHLMGGGGVSTTSLSLAASPCNGRTAKPYEIFTAKPYEIFTAKPYEIFRKKPSHYQGCRNMLKKLYDVLFISEQIT